MSSRSLLLPSALACWATLAMLACPGGQSGDEGNNRSAASDGNGSSTLLPFCSYSDDNGPDVRRRRHVCVSRDPGYTSGMLRWPAGHTPPGSLRLYLR
ncbi:MAG: hypothetical protein ABI895_35435 [Deltaproteobacteria bacterium]